MFSTAQESVIESDARALNTGKKFALNVKTVRSLNGHDREIKMSANADTTYCTLQTSCMTWCNYTYPCDTCGIGG